MRCESASRKGLETADLLVVVNAPLSAYFVKVSGLAVHVAREVHNICNSSRRRFAQPEGGEGPNAERYTPNTLTDATQHKQKT